MVGLALQVGQGGGVSGQHVVGEEDGRHALTLAVLSWEGLVLPVGQKVGDQCQVLGGQAGQVLGGELYVKRGGCGHNLGLVEHVLYGPLCQVV